VAGTVLPTLFAGPPGLFVGLVLGANLGDLYAGNRAYALERTVGRVAIAGGTVALMALICSDGACDIFGADDGTLAAALLVGVAGFSAAGILGALEVRGVADRTRARNERSTPRLSVIPTLDTEGKGVGLALQIRF
jgi:hypothetical protein